MSAKDRRNEFDDILEKMWEELKKELEKWKEELLVTENILDRFEAHDDALTVGEVEWKINKCHEYYRKVWTMFNAFPGLSSMAFQAQRKREELADLMRIASDREDELKVLRRRFCLSTKFK